MRIRRSLLITPGHRGDRAAKAARLPIDGLVLDLEDGVPPSRKAEARAAIAQTLETVAFGYRERLVRINAWGTEACLLDLAALPLARVDTLFVPKVESAVAVLALADHLSGLEARQGITTPIPLILTLETPRGVLDGLAIASASRRCSGLFFGPGDYAVQVGCALTPEALQVPRALVAAAAGAVGAQAIDAPYLLGLRDHEGTKRDALLARSLGYVGKLLFHPDQIAAANEVFSPDAAAIARAEKFLAAYAEAEKAGEAVAYVDGEFIAMDLVPKMELVLAIAAAVRERGV